jgi:hypothetical protein
MIERFHCDNFSRAQLNQFPRRLGLRPVSRASANSRRTTGARVPLVLAEAGGRLAASALRSCRSALAGPRSPVCALLGTGSDRRQRSCVPSPAAVWAGAAIWPGLVRDEVPRGCVHEAGSPGVQPSGRVSCPVDLVQERLRGVRSFRHKTTFDADAAVQPDAGCAASIRVLAGRYMGARRPGLRVWRALKGRWLGDVGGGVHRVHRSRSPRLRWSAFLLCARWHMAEDLTQTALAKAVVCWRKIARHATAPRCRWRCAWRCGMRWGH